MAECTHRITLCCLLTIYCALAGCVVPSTSENNWEHPGFFDSVFTRADAFGQDSLPEAFHYVDAMYASFPNPGPIDLARKYNYKLGYYWITQDAKQGRLYADSILLIMKGKTSHPDCAIYYGQALLHIGDIFRTEGKYNDAFAHYFEGRAYIIKAGDTCFFNEYSSRLATTYYKQKRFRDALPYYQEAFATQAACDSDPFYKFRYQQGNLDNMGLCYDYLGMADSAMFYYDSALKYIDRHSKTFVNNTMRAQFTGEARAVIYGNKGSLLLRQGDTASAEKLYMHSIAVNLNGNETRDAQITIVKLVTLLLAQKRHAEAKDWLKRLKTSLSTLPDQDNELQWYKLSANLLAATGNTGRALTALRDYVQLKDSSETAAKMLPGIDIQREFDHLTSEYEHSLLIKENEIKTIYLYIAVLLSLMALIIIYLIWQHWHRSKKHVKELRRLNEQMSQSLSALEQSQFNNSKMLKIVAHDLRNPVGAIISLTDMIWMNESKPPDETNELLGMMRESGEKALGLISELLHLNITTQTEMEPVEIDVVLEYCVDLLQLKAKEKDQHILLNTVPVTLMASREKIWRVFSNLITNALKFSRNGADVEINMRRVNGTLRISVKDEGIGIPPDMKDKIFSMSAGAGRKGTQGEESFGLGLAISKQIVESHSGKIWFESEEGKGSVFYVDLRVNPAG